MSDIVQSPNPLVRVKFSFQGPQQHVKGIILLWRVVEQKVVVVLRQAPPLRSHILGSHQGEYFQCVVYPVIHHLDRKVPIQKRAELQEEQ